MVSEGNERQEKFAEEGSGGPDKVGGNEGHRSMWFFSILI